MAQDSDYNRTILFIRIGLSAIILIASLWIILSQNFSSDADKWAFGMIGLVVGYWLR
jgi:uncharacterized membrane protein